MANQETLLLIPAVKLLILLEETLEEAFYLLSSTSRANSEIWNSMAMAKLTKGSLYSGLFTDISHHPGEYNLNWELKDLHFSTIDEIRFRCETLTPEAESIAMFAEYLFSIESLIYVAGPTPADAGQTPVSRKVYALLDRIQKNQIRLFSGCLVHSMGISTPAAAIV